MQKSCKVVCLSRLMDLGSSNGTYLNGRRIQPDVDVALSHQDVIALGTLQIQVLLHDM